jgi:hypothetical protein
MSKKPWVRGFGATIDRRLNSYLAAEEGTPEEAEAEKELLYAVWGLYGVLDGTVKTPEPEPTKNKPGRSALH